MSREKSLASYRDLWFANIRSAWQRVDFNKWRAGQSKQMLALFLSVIRFLRLLFSGHQAVAIENAALRLQLAAFQRKRQRPVLKTFDRVFWITLRRFWSGWRGPLVYVQPDTIVRWQR